MKRLRRLDVRLFGSYALVVIVVVAALVLTFAFRAPTLFADRIRNAGEAGRTETESHQAFAGALWSTLPIALVVSAAAAALVAAFVARQILRPIAAVRRATGRLAAGRYDERVAEPTALELAALAGDVNRLADALQHTEARRARLIGEVAHEMRTPLTAINGYVEGILDGVFEPTEEILTNVGEETARLQRLATDLATLSRAEEGALELRTRPTPTSRSSPRVAATRLRPQYDDKGVALELVDGPVVAGACRPRSDHPGSDEPARQRAHLHAVRWSRHRYALERTGTRRSATVSDNGVGIAAADLPLVFERFFRVPGLDRPPGGSGIGLTVAAGIARAHHGDIRADSAGLGEGADVHPRAPVRRAARSERASFELHIGRPHALHRRCRSPEMARPPNEWAWSIGDHDGREHRTAETHDERGASCNRHGHRGARHRRRRRRRPPRRRRDRAPAAARSVAGVASFRTARSAG